MHRTSFEEDGIFCLRLIKLNIYYNMTVPIYYFGPIYCGGDGGGGGGVCVLYVCVCACVWEGGGGVCVWGGGGGGGESVFAVTPQVFVMVHKHNQLI